VVERPLVVCLVDVTNGRVDTVLDLRIETFSCGKVARGQFHFVESTIDFVDKSDVVVCHIIVP